ncbi:CHAP domain-containing protein [Ruminococcus sp.]|uniref:CHAP domain-containing protein n=1 Tax=Ruminococcus sp. TaxID=41978 RepID=UPI0025FC65B6|nr:CHAP domain-containing protein [Ruminococcus sp.]
MKIAQRQKRWFMKWTAMMAAAVMMLGMYSGLWVSAAYENTHTNTGNQREDIVAIAETQVGYHESGLEGRTSGNNNDTKYDIDLYQIDSSYHYAWCQAFVSWCAIQAGVSSSVIKRTAGTIDEIDFFKSQDVWHDGPYYGASYTPQRGDIIYFYSSTSNSHRHAGIVTDVSDGYVHTIEANTSGNVVARNRYPLTYSNIVGYGVPNYSGNLLSLLYQRIVNLICRKT